MEDSRALGNLKVLELGGRGPVPFTGSFFADHGADVVRIDRLPNATDASKTLEHKSHPLRSGKRSIAVDLRSSESKDVLQKLLPTFDVVLEGFRPGVVARLGLGYEDCRAINPSVVYGSVSGWGDTGELELLPGHDINYISMAGVLGAIGHPDVGPVPPLNIVGDYGAGALLATGVLAGIVAAKCSGEGRHIRTSIFESSLYFMSRFFNFQADGRWIDGLSHNDVQGAAPYYATYRTKDGGYLAVGAIEQVFYDEFVRALDLDPSTLPDRTDPDSWNELRTCFARAIETRTRDDWWSEFRHREACVTPVFSLEEARREGQSRAVLRGGDASGVVPSFTGDGPTKRGPAPLPGQHTREVLVGEQGGLSAEGFEALVAAGVVHQT